MMAVRSVGSRKFNGHLTCVTSDINNQMLRMWLYLHLYGHLPLQDSGLHLQSASFCPLSSESLSIRDSHYIGCFKSGAQ